MNFVWNRVSSEINSPKIDVDKLNAEREYAVCMLNKKKTKTLDDVIYNDEKYHVQDIDLINGMVQISHPDKHGICLYFKWAFVKEVSLANS